MTCVKCIDYVVSIWPAKPLPCPYCERANQLQDQYGGMTDEQVNADLARRLKGHNQKRAERSAKRKATIQANKDAIARKALREIHDKRVMAHKAAMADAIDQLRTEGKIFPKGGRWPWQAIKARMRRKRDKLA